MEVDEPHSSLLKSYRNMKQKLKEKARIFFLDPTHTLQLIPTCLAKFYRLVFRTEFALCKIILRLKNDNYIAVEILKAGIKLYPMRKKELVFLLARVAGPEIRKLIEFEIALHSYYKIKNQKSIFEFPNYWAINENSTTGEIEALFEIVVWYLGHNVSRFAIETIMKNLSTFGKVDKPDPIRILPHFTSNLGHLGFLFLYVNYYRFRDTNRIIHVPSEKIANKFYLETIQRQSPLTITVFDREDLENDLGKLDFLLLSREKSSTYRTESSAAAYSSHLHPEFHVDPTFQLKLTHEENLRGLAILSDFLGREISWFGLIHIRGPRNGLLDYAQARDANIDHYRKIGAHIESTGGLLIRMGDGRFPRLNKSFQAFDYAHSKIRSEFMDVWLWNNCRFWVGNMNGASVPPLTFGKRRLLTDMWYFDENGPYRDFYVPKKLYCNGKRLTFDEVKNLPISKVMNRKWIEYCGYSLKELSDVELQQAFLIFFETICNECSGIRVNSTGCDACSKANKSKLQNIMQRIDL